MSWWCRQLWPRSFSTGDFDKNRKLKSGARVSFLETTLNTNNMPPAVRYSVDGGDQLDQSNFDEAEIDESFQNGDERNQSRPSSKPNPDYIPFLERLRRIPQVREIPWRPGQELPAEKAEDSPRVQQRGAILLSTRGKVMELKCEHCARG